jgi:SHS2 domain-containing protein
MRYKFIDRITSDVMFEAYGKDLKELFINSAHALMSVICQIEKVGTSKCIEVEVSGKDLADLMFNWLQELILRVDIEAMFFSKFELLEIKENKLRARICGEDICPEKGETIVKAITYHEYKFEKTKDGWMVRVSLDI